MITELKEVRDWAFEQHALVNHKYDKYNYSFHLQMVADVADRFYVDPKDYELVQKGCYLHDILEDTRNTYNDVKKLFGVELAELVFALTNNKGRTRAERANDDYYDGIRAVRYGVFVKLCDRIANTLYSKEKGSGMYLKYRKELPEFIEKLDARRRYPQMVDYLESI